MPFLTVSSAAVIKGVVLSIVASCLFGSLYYFPVLLQPMKAEETFCWRLLMSVPTIALLISFEHAWHLFGELVERIKKQPIVLAGLLLSAFLLGIQMFLFIWAPLNGRALSTSLGYFALPLVMVVTGRLLYKETFSPLQFIAVSFALVGVLAEVYVSRSFSWETAVVALGYPVYLVFRRKLKTDNVVGLFLDFLLIAIVGCVYLWFYPHSFSIIAARPLFWILIPSLGAITAVAFAAYFAASRILPLGLFGMLSYVEPVLFVLVSMILLGEGIPPGHLFSYSMIWAAVFFLVLEGAVHTIRYFLHHKKTGRNIG